jgi:hypothetical protein
LNAKKGSQIFAIAGNMEDKDDDKKPMTRAEVQAMLDGALAAKKE